MIGVMRQDREKELAGILSIKDIVREISKDHHATPGFRLMEFLKSKMKPEPKAETKVEAAAESKPEVASAATTDVKDAKIAAPADATATPVEEVKTETPVKGASTDAESAKVVEEPQTASPVKL